MTDFQPDVLVKKVFIKKECMCIVTQQYLQSFYTYIFDKIYWNLRSVLLKPSRNLWLSFSRFGWFLAALPWHYIRGVSFDIPINKESRITISIYRKCMHILPYHDGILIWQRFFKDSLSAVQTTRTLNSLNRRKTECKLRSKKCFPKEDIRQKQNQIGTP